MWKRTNRQAGLPGVRGVVVCLCSTLGVIQYNGSARSSRADHEQVRGSIREPAAAEPGLQTQSSTPPSSAIMPDISRMDDAKEKKRTRHYMRWRGSTGRTVFTRVTRGAIAATTGSEKHGSRQRKHSQTIEGPRWDQLRRTARAARLSDDPFAGAPTFGRSAPKN